MSPLSATSGVPESNDAMSSELSQQCTFAGLNSIVDSLRVTEMSSEIERLKAEAELNKMRFRLQHLLLEKQMVIEQFRAQERIYEQEIATTLSKLGGRDMLNAYTYSEIPPRAEFDKVATLGMSQTLKARPEPSAPMIEADTPQMLYPNLMTNKEPTIPLLNQSNGLSSLNPLKALGKVTIRQLVKENPYEDYELVGPGDQLVYTAKLNFSGLNMTYIPSHKRFLMTFGSSVNPEAFTFHPGLDHVDLFVGDQRVCSVRRQPTLSKLVLLICDRRDRPLLKIKGPAPDQPSYKFNIQTLNKDPIGSISKEVLPSSSQYVAANYSVIDFPEDLDVSCKAAIIGASFLIVNKAYDQIRKEKCRNTLRSTY